MTQLPPDDAHDRTPSETRRDEAQPVAQDPDAGHPAQGTDVRQLIEERDAAREQVLRAQAELENYRKRVSREREDERRYATLPLIRDLLPSLDNLQRALDAARHADDLSGMLQGVEMVSHQIDAVLAQHGATPIAAVGEPFDPNRHQAIQQIPSAAVPPMTVMDEVERGYALHDRVIRPSSVIVSVAPSS